MQIALPFQLSFQDYPEPDAWAVVVYFQGCLRNCRGCQNPELQKINIGTKISVKELDNLLEDNCARWHTRNVVFSGGDPLFFQNLPGVVKFLQTYGEKYNICIYTGAEIEEITRKFAGIDPKPHFKYIKGGAYIDIITYEGTHGKTDEYFQLATTNQFFLDSELKKISQEGRLNFDHE